MGRLKSGKTEGWGLEKCFPSLNCPAHPVLSQHWWQCKIVTLPSSLATPTVTPDFRNQNLHFNKTLRWSCIRSRLRGTGSHVSVALSQGSIHRDLKLSKYPHLFHQHLLCPSFLISESCSELCHTGDWEEDPLPSPPLCVLPILPESFHEHPFPKSRSLREDYAPPQTDRAAAGRVTA